MTQNFTGERIKYEWLKWLQEEDPDFAPLHQRTAIIEELHPDWHPVSKPYLGIHIGQVEFQNEDPFDADQLLSQPGHHWAPEFGKLSWSDPETLTPPLYSLQTAVRQDPAWGIEVAQAMMIPEPHDTPAWTDIVTGWDQGELTEEQQASILSIIANPQIQSKHGDTIAEHLYNLVRYGGKPYALNLLDQAESLALPLWDHMQVDNKTEPNQDWMQYGIAQHGIAYLPLFWTNAAAIRMRKRRGTNLSQQCRQSLGRMLTEDSTRGLIAQSAIASQTAFLLGADQSWTLENVIPLFSKSNEQQAAAAWEGFIAAQTIDELTAEQLGRTMHEQLQSIASMLPTPQGKVNLARCYSAALCYYTDDPNTWMKETAQKAPDMLSPTMTAIRQLLHQADAVQQKDWWSRWIKEYWKDRNLGAPKPLTDREANELVSWVPHLPAVYEEAAQMASNTPLTTVDQTSIQEISQSLAAQEHISQTAQLLLALHRRTQHTTPPSCWLPAKSLIEQILAPLDNTEDKLLMDELLTRIESSTEA